MDRLTDRHTDTPIAILQAHPGGEAVITSMATVYRTLSSWIIALIVSNMA